MARPHPLQMFAPSASPASSTTSPSPSAPTPSSTPAPPPMGSSPSASASASTAPHPSYIQRHFKRRLQSSKQACDAELRKVIHAVTAYVEHSLRAQQEAEWEEEEARVREREALLAVESTSDDAGDESDVDGSGTGGAGREKKKKVSTHRHRRSFILSSGTKVLPLGTTALMIPGTSSTHIAQPPTPTLSAPSTSPVRMSASSSPTSTWSRASNPTAVARRASRSSRYTLSPPLPPTTVSGSAPPALPSQPASLSASRSSSRSRSRSPLPPSTARPRSPAPASASAPESQVPKLDFITTLRDLVSLSTQLVELPLSALTSPSSPHTLSEIVQSVQALGRAWDLRPDWHGRGWYVQVLLAVASLSRVVEWWQAEREFWSFGEQEGEGEGEEGEVEGMTFVLRPADAEHEAERGEAEAEEGRGSGEDETDREEHRESTVVPEDRPRPERHPSLPPAPESLLLGTHPIPAVPSALAELTRPQHKDKAAEAKADGEENKMKPTEDLRALAEKSLAEQVVMELGLDGERVLWVSPGWENIVGTPAEQVVGHSIAPWLAPAEAHVFVDATGHLEREDPKTIEARFLMWVSPVHAASPDNASPVSPVSPTDSEGRYVEMEGKGMLVKDRVGGEASHTLWLFRPNPNPSPVVQTFERLPEAPQPQLAGLGMAVAEEEEEEEPESLQELSVQEKGGPGGAIEPITPFSFDRPISTSTILCRICECQVPDWFFEKHNESCNEVHRLEADIAECDESLQELMSTIAQMVAAIDRAGQGSPVTIQGGLGVGLGVGQQERERERREREREQREKQDAKDQLPPEYRGVPLFTPASVPASPLQSGGLRTSASARLQRVAVRKLQKRLLDDLAEILQVAREIEMPAVSEDAPNVPLERQPFLTPASEEKIALIRAWHAPNTDDPALACLVQDAETLMRTKVEQVGRMRDTLGKSERVRHEWEVKVEQTLAELESLGGEGSGSGEEGDGSEGSGSAKGEGDSGRESGGVEETTRPSPVAPSPVPFEQEKSALIEPQPQPALLPAPVPHAHSGILFSAHGLAPAHGFSPSPPTSSSAFSSPHSGSPASLFSPPHTMSPLASSPMIPSPLAFTTPILPHHTDEHHAPDASPAPSLSTLQMTLGSPAHSYPPSMLSHRRSPQQSLVLPEPTVMVTPPLSPTLPLAMPPPPANVPLPPPMAVSTSSKSSSRHSRRLSMAQAFSPTLSTAPLSPRIPSIAPASKTTPSSIRDFEIIKPISKGAFGSVYLAKKKSTGDYYAIKVLKKADMIAKNQVTNVKAERTILMQQSDSPFVVKLYFTFQNKDYLYLVMEYLNGGDCAALIKTIGALPEDWARTYVAEVVMGLENIHARGIVHRDLKPDNLLIDSRGHLKLTDFGLSRIGLFGRQARDGRSFVHRGSIVGTRARIPRSGFPSRQTSIDSGVHSPSPASDLPPSSLSTLDTPSSYGTSYFTRGLSTPHLSSAVDDPSESSGSEGISVFQRGLASESPQQSFASELTSDLRAYHVGGGTPPGEQKFVGTPDYLAPETILATSEDDRAVDWWALGVITYEFLYGFPPFHAESPAQVFDNIISRRIEWYEEHIDYGPEARDFMERLLCIDPAKRLGANGAAEVKDHPWLKGTHWDTLTSLPAQFVPQITDPESTDYFDPRGAHLQLFQDEEPVVSASSSPKADKMSLRPGSHHLDPNEPGLSPALDDFGTFSYKNLPVLKQANDDVIRKLKAESPQGSLHGRRRSLSQRLKGKQTIITAFDPTKIGPTNPPSPSTSTSSIASTPSRGSFPPSTPGSSIVLGHGRRPSEHGALERFKTQLDEGMRRNSISMPSRLRTASISSGGDQVSEAEPWQPMSVEVGTPATSVGSAEMGRRASDSKVDQTVVCLLAEDNVISQKVQEILLTRLGCRCVLVGDGYEAILAACNDIRFDCILMDYQMPILDGEVATKFIKGTNNKNNMTPVIAVSAYTAADPAMNNELFAASLSKPVQRDALLAVMKKLGFKIVTESAGTKHPHKVVLK